MITWYQVPRAGTRYQVPGINGSMDALCSHVVRLPVFLHVDASGCLVAPYITEGITSESE